MINPRFKKHFIINSIMYFIEFLFFIICWVTVDVQLIVIRFISTKISECSNEILHTLNRYWSWRSFKGSFKNIYLYKEKEDEEIDFE